MRPTRTLVALAAALAVACLAYPGEVPVGTWFGVAVINAVLAALVLVDLARAPGPDTFRIERRHPSTVTMHRPFQVEWHIANLAAAPLVLRVGDDLAPSLGATTRRFALRLAPHGHDTASTEAQATRRGRFEPRRMVVEVRGPLGLAWRAHRVDHATDLAVHPVFRSRSVADTLVRQSRSLDAGSRRAKGVGSGTEFLQLRDYAPDDQFSRIDWAASARRGRHVVRTYQPEENQTVVLVLDSGRMMAANVADVPRFEHAIDASRALATVTSELGDRVGLITFDDRVNTVMRPQRSRSQPTRVVDALFDVQPQLVESDYREAFTEMATLLRKRCLLVLLTELSPAADATGLFDAIPILTRRHRVVVACISDPAIERWADARPSDVGEAYRGAAAASALEARRARLARARRLGATVIDAAPDRLAGDLVESYLAIKATGAL